MRNPAVIALAIAAARARDAGRAPEDALNIPSFTAAAEALEKEWSPAAIRAMIAELGPPSGIDWRDSLRAMLIDMAGPEQPPA